MTERIYSTNIRSNDAGFEWLKTWGDKDTPLLGTKITTVLNTESNKIVIKTVNEWTSFIEEMPVHDFETFIEWGKDFLAKMKEKNALNSNSTVTQ